MSAQAESGTRVALVAVATRGAGRAIAIELGSEIDRPETIEETRDLIRAAGGEGSSLVVDHEDPDAVAGLLATVEREHGRLDVLVNGADVERIVTGLTAELTDHPAAVAGVTPGWLRSEKMLENFGVTDTDGSRPDCWGYLAAYGWEREDCEGIEDFR